MQPAVLTTDASHRFRVIHARETKNSYADVSDALPMLVIEVVLTGIQCNTRGRSSSGRLPAR